VAFVPTALLSPGLQRLLEVRRVVNLRNPAHSLVKLMNPCVGKSLIVSSYTHPEYAISMAATFALTQANALLLRGTEGEAVADPRRTPTMQAFVNGQTFTLQEHQAGPLTSLPNLPTQLDAATTAAYIQSVMTGAAVSRITMKHDLSDSNAAGQVTLVGAGPGDPELLTLKALKAIQAATVLMVDDLVNEAIVAYASPEARIVHVGKRGGCKSTPQSFIEKLMVTAALEGENVVRLKGGDPFIFGRGGEEVENLQAAGIRVSVINGITSGLAAVTSLNVPLTHREHAHGVVFVTGHAKPGDTGTDWRALAHTAYQAKLTLVIYMGVSGAAHIQDELLYGLPDTTPVAIVHNASLPTQRHAVCTLGELQTTIAREGLASPSVIVVGDVMQGLLAAAQVPEREPLGQTRTA